MIELLGFISYLIQLYIYIVIATVILSWLMALRRRQSVQPVRAVAPQALCGNRALLRPIRNAMPNLGAIDISPVVLILICFFIQRSSLPNLAKLFA